MTKIEPTRVQDAVQQAVAACGPKDEAIIELAHVSRKLVERLIELGDLPGAIREAISNKIDYYAARSTTCDG